MIKLAWIFIVCNLDGYVFGAIKFGVRAILKGFIFIWPSFVSEWKESLFIVWLRIRMLKMGEAGCMY